MFRTCLYFSLFLVALMHSCTKETNDHQINTEICIYGATPAGITAAIAAKEEGHKVTIVEPSHWSGGILGAGLKPVQDCPNFEAVGGLTRKLLLELGMEDRVEDPTYDDVFQAILTYMSPKQLREDFQNLLEEHGIELIYEHRVSSVEKRNGVIEAAYFDLAPPDSTGLPTLTAEKKRNLAVKAKIFIDASYEGDLMAASGVTYRTGREPESEFNESLAGVRPPIHVIPIDPYVVPGDESSGLLPLVVADHQKPIGSGDEYTQAYNFRFYITNEPEYRAEIKKPDNYDPDDYELLGRYVEYLKVNKPSDSLNIYLSYIFPGWLNARDYNYQRESLFTMAPLGISQEYATGDYAKKAEIWKYHQDYLSGVYTFMSTDERVPIEFRQKTAKIGFDLRHFPETFGWPNQLYVRVTRRLVGDYTVNQDDVYNKRYVEDPVGLAQYGIDTYPSRRYAYKKDGNHYVAVEGNMFVGGPQGPTKVPYQIPYRSIVPKIEECKNLIVPVCFSATHVGYASARMEPVFMVLGESAGVAASQALNEQTTVQQIDLAKYHENLIVRGQRLVWEGN